MLSHTSMIPFNLQCEAQAEWVLPCFAERELKARELSVLLKVIELGCGRPGTRYCTLGIVPC